MKIGTKSLLYGAHQVVLHPIFVGLAWRRLYGSWPRDYRIWLAFVVHDWGYWGCPNMDGAEGKLHPWGAARWFSILFDGGWRWRFQRTRPAIYEGGTDAALRRRERRGTPGPPDSSAPLLGPWGRFCLLHSRSLARRYDLPVSELCAPDKLGAVLMPRWLYLKLTNWTGELEEYMAEADTTSGRAAGISTESPEAWFDSLKAYLTAVAQRIVDGGEPGVAPSGLAERP